MRALWIVAMVVWAAGGALADSQSASASFAEYNVVVLDSAASRYPADGLLGTHSLWWGHQSALMNKATGETLPEVVGWLRDTRGIVRFGGGVNEAPWDACGAPRKARVPYKVVPWSGPMVCQFGVPEYLDLTRQTGGDTAWLVANLVGGSAGGTPANVMAEAAGDAARSFLALASDLKRVWELGNELDRGAHLWSPEKMAQRASAAARTIHEADPDARLILPLMDYDHPLQPKRKEFNRRLLTSITSPVHGIAHHIYYDGLHGGPSIPTQLRPMIDSAALYRQVKGQPPEVWVTEHGRWPDGETSDPTWRDRWYQTNDLSGVLATADFLIALTQLEDVAGAMLHGLRAGPWNVFDVVDGELQPTGVGRLLDMFARDRPVLRLKTTSAGPNHSGYRGGYDLRTAAFKTATPGELVVWAVNRSPVPSRVFMALPAALKASFRNGASLGCSRPNGRCDGGQFSEIAMRSSQIEIVAGGLYVTLPAAAVTVFTLERP